RDGHEFPEDRPLRVGAIEHKGRIYRLHVHVVAAESAEAKALYRFRDVLRMDEKLRDAYQAKKQAILQSGTSDPAGYTHAKGEFINAVIGSSAAYGTRGRGRNAGARYGAAAQMVGVMRVFGFAGWSGSGKTTLVERLIPQLRAKGLVVSLV